jgi:type I restriction-modification system DNA methylase subunit
LGTENQVYASERDFVARFLLPKLKEAAERLGFLSVIDFWVEKSVDGIPDLSAEKGGKGLFIVEAKFKKKVARVERDIEPLDPDVIDQAVKYAAIGGFPYFTTCNTKRIVLFQLRPGTKAIESVVAALDYEKNPDWAETLLKTSLELVPVQLKALDDTLVDELHDAFSDLYLEFSSALRKKLQDQKFKNRYDDWLESQGIKQSDEANRLIAEQTAYLQLNKLLFYQVIRVIYPDKLKPLKIDEERDIQEALSEFYQDALRIDYTPIYQSDVMSEIPLTPRAEERIRTLLDTLNEFDFSRMESDFIGRIYEKLISPAERKRLGQFYTPPGIVNLIVNLTITGPDDIVLDPGCGSGGFLVGAYHRLRELNGIPKTVAGPMGETYHRQILEQLYGIDINQFPAHLTTINLVVQDPKARIKKINATVSDFFDVKPGAHKLFGFKGMTTEGEPTVMNLPATFDVITANPPYIRQELLGEKEKVKIRSLVEGEYPSKLSIGKPHRGSKTEIVLDKQSDIYIYFYIHAIRFLKDGGRLGFISSNKWLEVGYGLPFQRFLLDNARILYVIEFDRAVFPDAEVNTEVTVLEKLDGEKNRQVRNKNLAKFVRINRAMAIDQLLSRIQREDRVDDEDLRILTMRQGDLRPGKWAAYLRAPPVYFRLIDNPKLKPFEQIADIVYGLKTGYDPYFIIDEDRIREWQIERRYLKPCAPPGKVLGGSFVIEPKHISQYFLIVHETKDRLRGTNVLRYIQYGEKLDATPGKRRKESVRLPRVETIRNRQLWYELPKLPVPSILFPVWFRYKYRPLLNNAKAQGLNSYYYITVGEENREVLAALLHSTLTQFLLEVGGRQYSGMLHTMVYELKRLPMLDPADFSDSQKKRLKDLFWKLNNAVVKRTEVQERLNQFRAKSVGEQGLFEKEMKEELDVASKQEATVVSQIDEIVYDTLGLLQEDRTAIAKGLRHLRELRKRTTRGLRIREED